MADPFTSFFCGGLGLLPPALERMYSRDILVREKDPWAFGRDFINLWVSMVFIQRPGERRRLGHGHNLQRQPLFSYFSSPG
jgi:hypothetical protein